MQAFEKKPKLLDVPDYSQVSAEPQILSVKELKEKFSL